MNLNRDSWHFKINDFFKHGVTRDLNHGYPVSLCKYFWATTAGVFKATFMVAVTSAIVFGVLATLFEMLTTPIGSWSDLAQIMASLTVIFMFIVLGAFLCKGASVLWGKVTKTKKYKEPGLVTSYIKAKKAKFCPNLELKD